MNSNNTFFVRLLLISLAVAGATALTQAGEIEVRIREEKALRLSDSDIELLPHQTVKATDHGGKEASYSGVPLYQILQKAGMDFGDSLRGPALSQYVLVTAADGYRVVFALPELDPRSTEDAVILADRCDDRPLGAAAGPYRLVLPKERRQFRWVRQVIRVEVLKAP